MRGHVVITFNVHRNGAHRPMSRWSGRPSRFVQHGGGERAACIESRPTPLPPEYPGRQGVLHGHVLLQRFAPGTVMPTVPRAGDSRGRCSRCTVPACGLMRPLLAVLGPTATGKSALGAHDGRALRRRNHQLRFDRRLSRLRHRHRQGAALGAARHPAPSDRHRRPDGRIQRRGLRARCHSRRSATSTRAAAADPRRRHRASISAR